MSNKYHELYIGDVEKGGFVCAMVGDDDYVKIWSGINCDCIRAVSKIMAMDIKAPNFRYFADTIHEIWTIHSNEFLFGKCWACYDDSEEPLAKQYEDEEFVELDGFKTDNCPHLLVDGDYTVISVHEFYQEYSLKESCLSQSQIFDSIDLESIKNFKDDLNYTTTPIRLVGNIVKIKPPEPFPNYMNQIQKLTIGDSNTNKKIKCLFEHNLVDYDKWEKGQRIELWGYYDAYDTIPFKVKDCRIISETQKTPSNTQNIRNHPQYNKWRDTVKAIGECYICGRTNHLEAHHINSVADYPQLAYDESNGVCLCKSCHNVYHEDYSNTGDMKSFMDFVLRYKRGDANGM